MKRHPTQGIRGAKPRLKAKIASPAKPIPKNGEVSDAELSRRYLLERNEAMHTKNLNSQMELAIRREQLIERSVVERQASFLFVAMRQKLLNLPRLFRRQFGPRPDCERFLAEEVNRLLKELRDLPKVAIDSDWEPDGDDAH
jgi:hypothetical protein